MNTFLIDEIVIQMPLLFLPYILSTVRNRIRLFLFTVDRYGVGRL